MKECSKVKYVDEIAAMLDIAKIKKRSKRSKIPTRAYLCSICNSWHLTSQPDYKKQYQELEIKYLTLKMEHDQLKIQVQEGSKEIQAQLKKDELVKQLKHQVKQLIETVKRVRKDNEELIIKSLSKK